MPNRTRFLVDQDQVEIAFSFLKQHSSFFVAPLVDQSFNNWVQYSLPKSKRVGNDIKDRIHPVVQDMIGLSEYKMDEDAIINALKVDAEWADRLLNLECLKDEDATFNQILDHQLGSLFENFTQALFKLFLGGREFGTWYYKGDKEMELLLASEPELVSRLLCLRSSPVFQYVYMHWNSSCESQVFYSNMHRLTKTYDALQLLKNLLKSAGCVDLEILNKDSSKDDNQCFVNLKHDTPQRQQVTESTTVYDSFFVSCSRSGAAYIDTSLAQYMRDFDNLVERVGTTSSDQSFSSILKTRNATHLPDTHQQESSFDDLGQHKP